MSDEILDTLTETEKLAERTMGRPLKSYERALVGFAATHAMNKARDEHIKDLERAVSDMNDYANLQQQYNVIITALREKKQRDGACPLSGNPHINPCPVCS